MSTTKSGEGHRAHQGNDRGSAKRPAPRRPRRLSLGFLGRGNGISQDKACPLALRTTIPRPLRSDMKKGVGVIRRPSAMYIFHHSPPLFLAPSPAWENARGSLRDDLSSLVQRGEGNGRKHRQRGDE